MGKKGTLGTRWKWGLVCLGLFIFGCELSLAHAGLKTCTVAEDDLELTIILPPVQNVGITAVYLHTSLFGVRAQAWGFLCVPARQSLCQLNQIPSPALLHPTQWPSHSDTNGHAGFG